MAIRTLTEHSVRMAIHFFGNFDVLKSLYLSQNWPDNTKFGDFVNLGVLFLTTDWYLVLHGLKTGNNIDECP